MCHPSAKRCPFLHIFKEAVPGAVQFLCSVSHTCASESSEDSKDAFKRERDVLFLHQMAPAWAAHTLTTTSSSQESVPSRSMPKSKPNLPPEGGETFDPDAPRKRQSLLEEAQPALGKCEHPDPTPGMAVPGIPSITPTPHPPRWAARDLRVI